MIDQMLQAEMIGNENSFNQAKSSLEALQKPTSGNVADADRFNKIGLKNLKDKNYSEASSAFASASKADPSDPKLLSNLGFAMMNAGDLNAAQKYLFSSLSLAPSRAVAWNDLGLVLAKEGDQSRAVSSLLIGYKVSNGATLDFLQHLSSNEANDASVREAGRLALSKVQLAHGQSTEGQALSSTSDQSSVQPKKIQLQENQAGSTKEVLAPGDVCISKEGDILWDNKEACELWNTNRSYKGIDRHGRDSIDRGARIRVLERDDGYVRVEVISGSDLVDGYGSGWFPESSLVKDSPRVHIEREHGNGLGLTMKTMFGSTYTSR
jgi:Flp pilus assembly protein TadD